MLSTHIYIYCKSLLLHRVFRVKNFVRHTEITSQLYERQFDVILNNYLNYGSGNVGVKRQNAIIQTLKADGRSCRFIR